jgi:hypothetical protein
MWEDLDDVGGIALWVLIDDQILQDYHCEHRWIRHIRSSPDFHQLTMAMGLRLLRPDRKNETNHNGNLGGMRQWIESINQTLQGQLDLEAHDARTPTGLLTRIAQRLLTIAAGIWHN